MSGASPGTPSSVVVKYLVAAAAVAVSGYLLWALRSLIVPAFVGGLLAYICRPVVGRLERWRIPRGPAVGLLLLLLAIVAVVSVNRLIAAMPSEIGMLELRVRALYSLNRHYQALMGLDASWTRGNRLYGLVHRDVEPVMDRVTALLALTPDERVQLVASRRPDTDPASATSGRLLDEERVNLETVEIRARRAAPVDAGTRPAAGPPAASTPAPGAPGALPAMDHAALTWLVSPLVFLFLLWDTGTIKRGLLGALPNRLFEPALAVLADLDQALGDYLRGLFLECCSLGLTVAVFMVLLGVPLGWAIAIGIFTAASNVAPYMGFAAALLAGLAYALLAEDVHPLLPFVTPETFAIWVVAAVALAELIKNVFYEPVVLGRAVKLHPLVIVLGVAGGAMLLGPVGMFLAVPTITVVKVFVSSTARHLTAYGVLG
jgi:predicted PurR-regulated permease PerM